MKKRFLSVALALTLGLSMVGCSAAETPTAQAEQASCPAYWSQEQYAAMRDCYAAYESWKAGDVSGTDAAATVDGAISLFPQDGHMLDRAALANLAGCLSSDASWTDDVAAQVAYALDGKSLASYYPEHPEYPEHLGFLFSLVVVTGEMDSSDIANASGSSTKGELWAEQLGWYADAATAAGDDEVASICSGLAGALSSGDGEFFDALKSDLVGTCTAAFKEAKDAGLVE